MTYEAIVCKAVNIRPHPNADRINLATASGYQVVVSKSVKEGTLGIFFPSDGQLSVQMCHENNLYRYTKLNKNPDTKGGFFEDNRRVRTQKMRGSISEGFWADLSILTFTGCNLSKLKEGDMLTELCGIPICNKYHTKATRNAMNRKKDKKSKKGVKIKDQVPTFLEPWDTKKLRMMIGSIPEGALVSISQKCHGSSGRTGHLQQEITTNWFQVFWNKTIGKIGLKFQEKKWAIVSGTRRVVLDPSVTEENGTYSGKKFRSIIHSRIKNSCIPKGFTLYYEIVGYDEEGGLIMGAHKIEDEEMKKKYGNKMVYSYGCQPGEFRVLVYRITQTNEEGRVSELPIHQVKHWCDRLGFEMVPQLHPPFTYKGDQEGLMHLCERLSQGSDVLDPSHIKEGVVVRVDAPGQETHLKYKSYHFCELEGIAKNTEGYIDMEEVEG